jgi:N-acetylmuramoyl-L-alanine amidase
MNNAIVCLDIGHQPSAPGAENRCGISEFAFNKRLAECIAKELAPLSRSLQAVPVYRRSFNELPAQINATGADFTVSLHANAYNGKASGTEVLYWYNSTKGKAAAQILQDFLVDALGLPNRGITAIDGNDRGGYFLKNTRMPHILAEPFFIDNDSDFSVANRKHRQLVEAYAMAIIKIAAQLKG